MLNKNIAMQLHTLPYSGITQVSRLPNKIFFGYKGECICTTLKQNKKLNPVRITKLTDMGRL